MRSPWMYRLGVLAAVLRSGGASVTWPEGEARAATIMLRVPAQARVLMAATFGLGISILAAAVLRGGLADLSTLALFATAVVLTELFQVEDDETSLDPRDAHISSFSTAVRFAAVIVLGPWAAALVAAFGVGAVDGTRGRH